MSNVPTPHINAKKEDIAPVVLMPGDPLRAKFIAENFLDSPVLVNNVRSIQGYTGTYRSKRVTVMASGMGMPSIGIYSYELFNFYDVDCIIRTGSAGAISPNVRLRDIVLGMGACTDSSYGLQFGLGSGIAPICDYGVLRAATDLADAASLRYHVGNIFSSDVFYSDGEGAIAWQKMGVLAVEMEAAALYMNAARAGKRALAICTVSDSLVTHEATTSEERESSFTDMIRLALDTAVQIQAEK